MHVSRHPKVDVLYNSNLDDSEHVSNKIRCFVSSYFGRFWTFLYCTKHPLQDEITAHLEYHPYLNYFWMTYKHIQNYPDLDYTKHLAIFGWYKSSKFWQFHPIFSSIKEKTSIYNPGLDFSQQESGLTWLLVSDLYFCSLTLISCTLHSCFISANIKIMCFVHAWL